MSTLTRDEIKAEIEKGTIRFDPQLQDMQWGDVCIDLRLGYKFTQLKESKVEIPLAGGIGIVADSGLWREKHSNIKMNSVSVSVLLSIPMNSF